MHILLERKTNYNQYLYFMVDKPYLSEYISTKSSFNGVSFVDEKLSNISKEDEQVVIKYLLDIMMKHDIITEEEYHTVLYKYS